MKLTDTQVNELIASKNSNLKKHWFPSNKATDAVANWCHPENLEDLVCGEDLWSELNTFEAYMSTKQVGRYTEEITLEIYRAIAREARKSNPLLAAAFDATKPTTK